MPIGVTLGVGAAVHAAAVVAGSASLGVGAFLYAQHRTTVLRRLITFAVTIFLFETGFAVRFAAEALVTLTNQSPLEAWALRTQVALGHLVSLLEMIASIIHVVVLPSLAFGIYGRPTSGAARVVSIVSAGAIAMGFVVLVVAPRAVGVQLVLSALLFGTIAVYLALMAWWLIRYRRAGRSRLPDGPPSTDGRPVSDAPFPPRLRESIGAIRLFLVVSACFVPLFVLDIAVSMRTTDPSGFAAILDNTSVPVYLIAVCVGSILVAYRFLNHPPLLEEQSVTDTARHRFGLTDRECEVVEFVLEGYTLPDAARVMGISPKTAENHLYAAYKKTGVTNRIQLFQLFNDNRRV